MSAGATTEQRNPRSRELDLLPDEQLVKLLLSEDAIAISAAEAAAHDLAKAVEAGIVALRAGGRIHYFGAGASGRLAVLDATEIVPTFGAAPGTVQAHFPGGTPALVDSSIDLEDAEQLGAQDAADVGRSDLVVGVAASGGTAYVRGALAAAHRAAAKTVLICCVPDPAITADLVVSAVTGPEALTGSTRLKAGTATKVLLNAFSTAVMVGTGRTYGNLMTSMSVTNDKLRGRAIGLLVEAAGVTPEQAESAFDESGGRADAALVALRLGIGAEDAAKALAAAASVRELVGPELGHE